MRTKQMWLMVFFVIVVLVAVAVSAQKNLMADQQITFSELVQQVDKGDIARLSVKGSRLEGTLQDGTRVFTTGPANSDYYLKHFAEKGVVPDFEDVGDGSWVGIAGQLAVAGLTLVLIVLFLRQLQMGSGKAMSFGKSRAKLLSESGKRITFADVAGADEAKEELEEIIQFLKDPRKFTRLGGRIPKGVLLMGAPGTGKTLLARAVAGEAGVPFFSISGSEFVEMFVGVGASRVRDLFDQAKKQAPCIIFIDEIDAVGRHRGGGFGGGGHDEREQTLNQLLVEMDGFDSAEGVILVAATNRPDVLDRALLRPGRFDRRVVVPAPDVRGRLGILQVHARRTPLDENVDLERIAKGTPGYSGADLENVVNEAALLAARANKRKIEQVDLEMAKDKVALGGERRSLVLSDGQKKRTAYHEAGHAIVARLMPEADPVNKITIIPRGMALGLTFFLPTEDYCHSKVQITSKIAVGMGGRAAEELIFNEFSTGASDDIKRATRLAHGIVCEYGMSDALGPVALGERSDESFLGRDQMRTDRNYSEATAQRIDDEVRRLVASGYDSARTILLQNLHILHKVAQVLLEKETVDGPDFERLVAQMNPIYPEPTSNVA